MVLKMQKQKKPKNFMSYLTLGSKPFIYNNGSDSVFIKTPFEKDFKKMEVDAINEKNEYNMKISDPKYYRKIKKDTIIIKVGNKIEKYVMISNKK